VRVDVPQRHAADPYLQVSVVMPFPRSPTT